MSRPCFFSRGLMTASFRSKGTDPLLNMFAFPGYYQWCCRSCMSLRLSWRIYFSWYMSVRRRTSSATLELPEDTLVMLPFHFSFTRKPTPGSPLLTSVWYSRWPLWRVVKLLFSSDLSECCHLFYVVFFRVFFQFLHVFIYVSNMLTLYVAIFSRSPLVWWSFLTHIFLAPPVCSLSGPEPPPRSHTYMLLGTGGQHNTNPYCKDQDWRRNR